ncbi:hypothetical protein AO380_0842 [Moraxella catarrhalis]|nr:hypothetical protein AO380_0842 [Moraxella catarrhalis]
MVLADCLQWMWEVKFCSLYFPKLNLPLYQKFQLINQSTDKHSSAD